MPFLKMKGSRRDVANLLGLGVRQINQLQLPRDRHGLYDLAICIQAVVRHWKDRAISAEASLFQNRRWSNPSFEELEEYFEDSEPHKER